jgi:hypothetical protein
MVRKAAVLSFVASIAACCQTVRAPTVYIVYPAPYGTIFDRTCPELLKAAIDERHHANIEEVIRRRTEFQSWWDKEGPRFMRIVTDRIAAPFPFREVQATLTVCPVSSMGDPLIVNARPWLSTADNPREPWQFAFTVFHEVMHSYVRPVTTTSLLRKKYADEPLQTLNHLHVLALEQFVLSELKQTEKLRVLDEAYKTRAPQTYRRAWEIVLHETPAAFVRELVRMRPHR